MTWKNIFLKLAQCLTLVFIATAVSGAPPASTTTALMSSPNPSSFGQTVALTATVSPSAATGLVTFYDGPTVLGEAGLVSGTAVLSTIALAPGTRSIRAYYGGNSTYAPSTSATGTEVVNARASATFSSASPLAISSSACGLGTLAAGPLAIVAGDFNGDGKPDLAVSLERTDVPVAGCVVVLLGDGNGGFAPASGSPAPVGLIPVALVVADFNGDGNLDLAVGSDDDISEPTAFAGGGVLVLLGNGKGTLTASPGTSLTLGLSAYSVAAGDFNGDGKTDLAALSSYQQHPCCTSHPPPPPPASYAGQIELGDGLGGLSFGSAFGPMNGMTVSGINLVEGDFNGDGRTDLAVLAYDAVAKKPSLWIELGDGNGSFTASPASPLVLTSTPNSLVAGDFNGDGRADLAVIVSNTDLVSIFLGDGNGGFTPASGGSFPVGSNPNAAVPLDFNGDGRLDLAVANLDSNDVTLLLGDGQGGFSDKKTFSVGMGPAGLVAGDFNGDGREDLAVANPGNRSVTLLLGSSAASLTVTVTHTGNFTQGQTNATYTVTVSNQGGPTNGTVTVTEMLPSGLTPVLMAGTGWICRTASCTRSDVLNAESSYPGITVTVNVAANASSPQVNMVSVSDGGSVGATSSDSTTVVAAQHPSFFNGEVSVGGGVYYLGFPSGSLFGFYNYPLQSFIYHYDLGFEYLLPANDASGDIYFYDFQSTHWWFTGPSLFPYLYDFLLGEWIFYEPDPTNPGHYTTNPRKFAYTSTHVIFTM